MENWYLLSCKTARGEQDRAEDSLLSQGFEILNPKVKIRSMQNGEVVTKVEPLFPGYAFVRFDPNIRSASTINHSRGVRCLITFGDVLVRISTHVIDGIKVRSNTKAIVIKLPVLGEKVDIKTGPMAGLKAIFQEPNGTTRSFLMINLLGSNKRINVDNSLFA